MPRHGTSSLSGLTSLTPCRYYSKPAFYVFVPLFELAVSCIYAATRVDRLFYVKGKEEERVRREEKGEDDQSMVHNV